MSEAKDKAKAAEDRRVAAAKVAEALKGRGRERAGEVKAQRGKVA